MKKLFGITIVIAILAAFFASAHPDGLDFISEKFGFAEQGIENSAPMSGYSLKFISEGRISTSLAGITGILITFSFFWLAVYVIKRKDKLAGKSFFNLFLLLLLLLLLLALSNFPAFSARPLVTERILNVIR